MGKKVKQLTKNDICEIVHVTLQNMLNEDITRSQLDSALEDLLKSKDFEKKVNNIVVDTFGEFIESMWTKKSFWKNMIKRK